MTQWYVRSFTEHGEVKVIYWGEVIYWTWVGCSVSGGWNWYFHPTRQQWTHPCQHWSQRETQISIPAGSHHVSLQLPTAYQEIQQKGSIIWGLPPQPLAVCRALMKQLWLRQSCPCSGGSLRAGDIFPNSKNRKPPLMDAAEAKWAILDFYHLRTIQW